MKPRTQEQRLLWALQAAWPSWTPAVALSQISLGYNARIHALRRQGWLIVNKLERRDGQKRSYFRLGTRPVATSRERAAAAPAPRTQNLPPTSAPKQPENLFGESLAPDRSYDE